MSKVKARTVLWYLAFFGFGVNYMIRINLNITIVEMVSKRKDDQSMQMVLKSGDNHEMMAQNITATTNNRNSSITSQMNASDHRPATTIDDHHTLERWILNWSNISYDRNGFDWNEYEQGLVLGSFYWLHWILQIPGGILARIYGTKLIFGLSNGVGCLCCFLIPICSYWNYKALIWVRVFQGFITGLAWPAMHVLTAKWIPPNERSKFVTAYLGSSVGIAVFYPFFGYVMHYSSWEWVYYICGVLGTVWYMAWCYFVYDSPAEHPRIDQAEVRYIEKSLGASIQQGNLGQMPWLSILTSRPVWINVIAQWGGIWGLFTLMTQAPTYFRVIHHWNIRATGWLSGLPHVMRMIFAYLFSMFADRLLRKNQMSRTNVRKLATAICCIVKGIIVLFLAYFGYNSTAAIILLTVATMVHGTVSSGPLAACVDIAPNYAGIVLGISGMVGGMPGFISPYVVGLLTLGNQTFEAWKNVFLIASGMLISSGILYVLFADSTLQPWNDGKIVKTEMETYNSPTAETEPLKEKTQKDDR